MRDLEFDVRASLFRGKGGYTKCLYCNIEANVLSSLPWSLRISFDAAVGSDSYYQ